MHIEIRIDGIDYTEATYDTVNGDWKEQKTYRPTEAMSRAFHAIRTDALKNGYGLSRRVQQKKAAETIVRIDDILLAKEE